jgi:hypothetical protein
MIAFHVGAIAAFFFFFWKALALAIVLWWISGSLGISGELLPFVPDLRKDKFHVWISKWHWVPLAVLGTATVEPRTPKCELSFFPALFRRCLQRDGGVPLTCATPTERPSVGICKITEMSRRH